MNEDSLNAAEITLGCTLPGPYALALAQLGQVLGDSASYVSRWAAVTAAKRMLEGELCISVYLS
jgi:hypothetical protein